MYANIKGMVVHITHDERSKEEHFNYVQMVVQTFTLEATTIMKICFYLYGLPHWQAASMAQSAARQSHNLKVVSSSLTRGRW